MSINHYLIFVFYLLINTQAFPCFLTFSYFYLFPYVFCFVCSFYLYFFFFFFFNDTATTEIYTLSLHDALPISHCSAPRTSLGAPEGPVSPRTTKSGSSTAINALKSPPRNAVINVSTMRRWLSRDRKSTRLNSSH